MQVRVRYFASLRESLGRDGDRLTCDGGTTVGEAWRLATGGRPMPEQLLAAVNQEYVAVDAALADGDEVAFFPPVTGG